jgi:hypothetical protein
MSAAQDTEGCNVTEDGSIILIRELHQGFNSVRNIGRLKVKLEVAHRMNHACVSDESSTLP